MDISIGLWTVDSGAMDPIYLATIIGMHIAIYGSEKERSSFFLIKKRKESTFQDPALRSLGCRSGFSI